MDIRPLTAALSVSPRIRAAGISVARYLKERILAPLCWDGMPKGRESMAQPERLG